MKSSNRIYYLSERNPDGTTAGNKARNDVENILQKRILFLLLNHLYHEQLLLVYKILII